MNKFRKLIYWGLSAAVDAGFTLPVESDSENPYSSGWIPISVDGWQSMFMWQDIAGQEIRVSVWFDYYHDRNSAAERESFTTGVPIARRCRYPEFLGAMASAWLERQNGHYIQGFDMDGILDAYVGRNVARALDQLEDPAQVILRPSGLIVQPQGRLHF